MLAPVIWCHFSLGYSVHVLLVDDDFRCGGTVACDRGSYKRVTTDEVGGRRIRADVVKAGETKRLEPEKERSNCYCYSYTWNGDTKERPASAS
jgi:hypothetical protein